MSKNVIVDGKTYNSISTVALALATGGTALFRDTDEASGGSTPGIVEIAAGSFSVASAAYEHTIKHGMSVKPDVAVCIPKYWYDTIDSNGALAAVSGNAYVGVGRRAVEGATDHTTGKVATTGITDTDIRFALTTLAKFQPTYTDADGNTGTQEYLWAAVKFAE